MFKNLKIRAKILLAILAITLAFGILLSATSLIGFFNIKNNLEASNKNLLNEVSTKSSATLKEQAFESIDSISLKQAEKFDTILSDIQLDTSSIALGLKNIYSNKANFKGFDVPEPSATKMGDIDDAYSASSKMYCATEKTPAIRDEMTTLSNAEFLVKPLYINNYNIDGVYIGTESNICYSYSVYNNMKEFVPSKQKWYTDAVKAFSSGDENAVWQSTYTDTITGQQCISCSKAFADSNGNILGVVCIDTSIDTIISDINDQEMKELGFIFLKDNQNKLIMASSNVDSNSYEKFNNLLNEENSKQKEIVLEDNTYVLSSNTVNATGWNLFVLKNEDEILSLVQNLGTQINQAQQASSSYISSTMWRLVLIFLLILAILIALSILVAKSMAQKITVPLMQLSDEAKKIGNGVLKRKIKIESNDEVGELAASFNKMTKDLVIYMRKLRKTTKEKEKINSELKIAKKIQKSMLPCIFPPFPKRNDFDIFATMKPARMVGGDFYDFFLIDDEHLAIVIGDVSGKGIAAALFMVIARTLIKNHAMCGLTPDKVFEIVNDQLTENNDAGMFVTAFMGILNLKTGEFIYSNAGHNKPLVYKSKNGFNWIETKPGFVLAGMNGIKYKLEKMQIEPTDMIYLYTDGVTEAHSAENALFSDEKLITTLNIPEVKNLDIKSILVKIDDEIKDFTVGAEQSDDITMLMMKYYGSNDNVNKISKESKKRTEMTSSTDSNNSNDDINN